MHILQTNIELPYAIPSFTLSHVMQDKWTIPGSMEGEISFGRRCFNVTHMSSLDRKTISVAHKFWKEWAAVIPPNINHKADFVHGFLFDLNLNIWFYCHPIKCYDTLPQISYN